MNSRRLTGALTLACCMAGSCPVAAQLTGTLFTSPEQREYLDYLRQDFLARSSERGFDISDDEIPEIPVAVAEAEEAEGPVIYTLGGIVSLRDGTQRIWLNGKTLGESDLPPEARLVRDNGMPALRFTTPSGNYLLRPGQTLTLESAAGTVVENYQRPAATQLPETSPASAPPDAADQTTVDAQSPEPASREQGTPDQEPEQDIVELPRDSDAGFNLQDVQELIEAVQAMQEQDDED